MLKTEMFPLSMNLQLFAEAESVEVAEVAATEAPTENPIMEELVRRSGQSTPVQEDVAQAKKEEIVPAPPTFEDVVKKHGLTFKDPEALANSYKSLQAEFTRKSEEVKRVAMEQQRQRAEMEETIAQLQTQAQSPPDGDEAKEAILNDPELLDKFYANPAETLQEITNLIAEQKVMEAVRPLMDKQAQLEAERENAKLHEEINQTVEQFSASHPDYAEYEDKMSEFISGLPDSVGQEMSFMELVEFAYEHVKGQDALQRAGGPSLEEKMGDAEFLKQLAENPAIRDAVLQSHLAGVAKSTENIPPILGPNTGGAMPASDPKQFRTFEDSKKSFLSSLGM